MYKEYAFAVKERSNLNGTYLVEFPEGFIDLKPGDYVFAGGMRLIVKCAMSVNKEDTEVVNMLRAGASEDCLQADGYAAKYMYEREKEYEV